MEVCFVSAACDLPVSPFSLACVRAVCVCVCVCLRLCRCCLVVLPRGLFWNEWSSRYPVTSSRPRGTWVVAS